MRIGILKCGQSPEELRGDLGDYDTMFERLLAGRGFDFTSYHVERMEFPPDVHAAQGWLLTGSRHGAYEDRAYIPTLEAFIRAAHAAAVPMVGICFGHQIMAQALGGKVEKYAGGWGIGATEYDFGTETLVLNAFHQDQVIAPPPGARVIAATPFCRHAALDYNGRALSFQPHPEFDDALMAALIHEARGEVPDAPLDAAQAGLGRPLDNPRIATRIADFFHTIGGTQIPSNPVKESC